MCESSNHRARLVLWEVRDYLTSELNHGKIDPQYTEYLRNMVGDLLKDLTEDREYDDVPEYYPLPPKKSIPVKIKVTDIREGKPRYVPDVDREEKVN